MTDIGWICLAVILGGCALFAAALMLVSGRAEKTAEAQRAAAEADSIATTEAAMTSAQANAAPDDATLDARLKAGTF
ncbi:hypothetical protein LWC05_16370 [Acetobacter sicerae]|uniref:Pilus assembly protein n=1 Tax=Acetobacter sicerae TaxID=85325 RepID=A0ABS8VWU0_9PROT|nr:hypothetical protein [Acetobacter sicerae]MCE0745448.1 hypothetical protein [Acetobacter sicerae]